MGCLGNGGMLATSSPEVSATLSLLTGYGHMAVTSNELEVGHQNHMAEGYNVPIDPFQAALLSVKLPRLREWTERRRQIASIYMDGLVGTDVRLPWELLDPLGFRMALYLASLADGLTRS